MTARRAIRLPLLGGMLLAARVASAVCPVTSACNDASVFLGNSACCGAHSCVLDGTVTLNGAVCTLDLDGRDLTISGTLNVGSNTLHLSAASVTISGLVNAKGTGQNPGGNVFITTRGEEPTAFRLAPGGAGLRVDLSGAGRGGGVLDVRADGDVDLDGRILATSSSAAGDGGAVSIDTPGSIMVSASVAANGGDFGAGGTIELTAGGAISLLTNVEVLANGGDGGTVSLDAGGAVVLDQPAGIEASGFSTNAGFGGSVDITSASATVNGVIESKGGGDPAGDSGGDGGEVTIDITTGSLLLSRTSSAIVVEGAGGGSAGIVTLSTSSPTNGAITIDAAISAGGRGGSTVRPGGGGEVSIESAQALDVKKIIDVHGTGAGTGEVELSAARDITLTNNLLADDAAFGGSLTVEAGHDVIANADLRARATGAGGGGVVTLSGGRDVIIKKNADVDASASGNDRGGDIAIDAGRNITVEKDGSLRANGAGTAAGGTIDLHAGFFELAGNLQLDGDILARGGSAAAAASASIALRGCQVTVGGTVDSRGDAGSLNSFTARSGITVSGTVQTTATGSNTLLYPMGLSPSFGNKVSPAFASVARPVCTAPNVPANCLVPCPNCGDNTVQFPEQCEPNVAGCANCSARCRTRTCNDSQSCTTDTCDGEFGCINQPKADGVSCTDTNPCTINEQCARGTCFGSPNPCGDPDQCTDDSCSAQGCVHTSKNCNDNNPCTLGDSCIPESGCTHTGLKDCPAGQVCNSADGNCILKSCQNANDCTDNNPCTSEACDETKHCKITALTGTECDNDTDRCNGVATCQSGVCVGKAPCDPNDGDACTADTCSPDVGCTNTDIPGCCNDRADCTPVTICTSCDNHECGTEPPGCCTTNSDCDDGNPCTDDGLCDTDNNRCPASILISGGDCGTLCAPKACVAGTCVAGVPVACPDDGDLCTDNFCDPSTGACTTAPIAGCCIGNIAGECGDICNFCDTPVNRCASEPDCLACAKDIDCDPLGRCTGAACGNDGKCTTVEPFDCDDGVAGTRDVCAVDGNGAPLCQHQCLNAAVCDDNDVCNGVETCSGGTCVAGPALDCNDNNACTIDTCDAARGCVPTDAQDFASVRCELDNIAAALAGASASEVTAPVRSKIERLLGRARTKLDAAEAAGPGKKARKALAVVKAQAKMLRQVVKTAVRKRKIAPAIGEAILGASDGASQAAQTLRSRLHT